MKHITLIIFLLFLINSLLAQFYPGSVGYNYQQAKLFKSQKVKTQTQILVEADGFQIVEHVNHYYSNGQLFKTLYIQDTTLPLEERAPEMRDEYNYTEDGLIQLVVLYGYDIVDIQHGFEYDDKGHITISRMASAEAREYSYTYDSNGNIMERIGKAAMFEIDDEGNSTGEMVMVDYEKSNYTWDNKGNLLTEVFYMSGEFYYKIIYTYNKNNSLANYKVFYGDTNDTMPSYTTSFTYDKNGLPLQMLTEEEGVELRHAFSYTYY